MNPPTIYAAGGTVQASGGIYIERDADRRLLELCLNGVFCYVLSSRQVGKSSLMVRAAESLMEKGCQPVILDLSAIGVTASAEAWYRSVLLEIATQLDIDVDVEQWWNRHATYALTHRFTLFFHHIMSSVSKRVVIFVDEIDSTLALDFTDDFFAAVRALHNIRATKADFSRLSFVLLGVATPSELVQDPTRTPFNIGERVELLDFSENEAHPLAAGLGLKPEDSNRVLRAVLGWTGGHPYLTLRTFRALQTNPLPENSVAAIDRRVQDLFFGDQAQADTNLQFVREMLTVRAGNNVRSILELYRDIWSGRHVEDQEKDPVISWLKLSGIVKAVDGRLRLRSRIYQTAFNAEWVRRYLPTGLPAPSVVYASGGVVQAARGIYVSRPADQSLLQCCRKGVPAYILSPRQTGKTSVMIRAAELLTQEGYSTAVIDLTTLGSRSSDEQWYSGVLEMISEQLALTLDVAGWSEEQANLAVPNRFVAFLTDVVLRQVRERVVIFFDELDAIMPLAFRQDFLTALRSIYQARAILPQLERLNVVLLGFGIPTDYVPDPAVSFFATAERIELTDYTFEEAGILATGLDPQAEDVADVLKTIIDLTGGHPYLTARTLRSLQEQPLEVRTAEEITTRVITLFVEPHGVSEPNMQFVARELIADSRGTSAADLLKGLLKVWFGHEPDSDSGVAARLKSIGVVKALNGSLELRNRIYEDMFNPGWIQVQLEAVTNGVVHSYFPVKK